MDNTPVYGCRHCDTTGGRQSCWEHRDKPNVLIGDIPRATAEISIRDIRIAALETELAELRRLHAAATCEIDGLPLNHDTLQAFHFAAYRKFPSLLLRLEAAERERDELRQFQSKLGDAIFASADKGNATVAALTAERDQLRAEVERLRESGRIGVDTWKYAAEQATARADVAQGAAVDLAKKVDVLRSALFEIRQHSAPIGIDRGHAAVDAIAVAALDATKIELGGKVAG